MGSPYLNSNESITLSTNNIIVNKVPAEAILTSERFIIIDAGDSGIRPQDIPFHAIETVTIGEDSDRDPVLSLSIVTGPGLTQALDIVFPQPPRMRRVSERDEWATRLKELSVIATWDGGVRATELFPPWVSGPLPGEAGAGASPADQSAAGSKFRNQPLAPRKPREAAAPKNRRTITAIVVVVIVIALATGAFLFAPSLLGKGAAPLPPVTPVPTEPAPSVPTPAPTTVAEPMVLPATTIQVAATPTTAPVVVIPQTGVWVRVTYEGTYTGTVGAPGRLREVTGSGSQFYQIPARDEIISASIQKRDNSGNRLTVEFYSGGRLIRSGSLTAPQGILTLNVDLKTV
jgi:hypothetical protein